MDTLEELKKVKTELNTMRNELAKCERKYLLLKQEKSLGIHTYTGNIVISDMDIFLKSLTVKQREEFCTHILKLTLKGERQPTGG